MSRLSMWTNSWNYTTAAKSSCLQSTHEHVLYRRRQFVLCIDTNRKYPGLFSQRGCAGVRACVRVLVRVCVRACVRVCCSFSLEKKYSSRPEFNLLTLEEARESMQRLQQQEDVAHRLSQQQSTPATSTPSGGGGRTKDDANPPPALPAVTSRIITSSSSSAEGNANAAAAAAGQKKTETAVRASASSSAVPRATPTAQALVASLSPKFKPPHENKCNCCFRSFTFTTRRHHCRCCNRAVCHSCSGMREATERMRALTSTPSGEVPDPQLLVRPSTIASPAFGVDINVMLVVPLRL